MRWTLAARASCGAPGRFAGPDEDMSLDTGGRRGKGGGAVHLDWRNRDGWMHGSVLSRCGALSQVYAAHHLGLPLSCSFEMWCGGRAGPHAVP